MVRSERVLPNTNPMPELDTEKFRKIVKKNLFMEQAVKKFQSQRFQSQRGNKQYFNLGLNETF